MRLTKKKKIRKGGLEEPDHFIVRLPRLARGGDIDVVRPTFDRVKHVPVERDVRARGHRGEHRYRGMRVIGCVFLHSPSQ